MCSFSSISEGPQCTYRNSQTLRLYWMPAYASQLFLTLRLIIRRKCLLEQSTLPWRSNLHDLQIALDSVEYPIFVATITQATFQQQRRGEFVHIYNALTLNMSKCEVRTVSPTKPQPLSVPASVYSMRVSQVLVVLGPSFISWLKLSRTGSRSSALHKGTTIVGATTY